MTTAFLTVFGIAIFEFWLAIPTGFALGLDPLRVGLATGVGGTLDVVAIVLLGDRFRAWLVKRFRLDRKAGAASTARARLMAIWERFGVVGLGLLAPLLVGAPIGAVIGLSLGAPSGRLMIFSSVGVLLWTAILTALGAAGIRLFYPAG
jgi:hypothetical protein